MKQGLVMAYGELSTMSKLVAQSIKQSFVTYSVVIIIAVFLRLPRDD